MKTNIVLEFIDMDHQQFISTYEAQYSWA